jgi:capsular exopolysaccharide synthesis family protein
MNTARMNLPVSSLDSQASPESEIDLMLLFRTLWRGKIWIILTTIIAILIGGYYAYSIATPLYTTRAVVMLENRQEQVVDIESVMTGLSGDQATVNTEVEVIRSRGLLEKLVLKLDLLNDPEYNTELQPEPIVSVTGIINFSRRLMGLPPREKRHLGERDILDATIDELLKKLSVSNIRQSYVFNILATSEDPQKAALIANTLGELYIRDQLEVKFDATAQATEWLTERVTQLQVELEDAESAVKEFVSNTDLVGPESLDALNRQLKDLRERLLKTKAAQLVAQKQADQLRTLAESGDYEEIVKQTNDRTLRRLFLAQGNANDGSLKAFEARLANVLQNADQKNAQMINQMSALSQSIDSLQIQIESQSKDLVELQQLQREAEASRLIYEYFLSRMKETSVQQGIQQADSRVLSYAVVPLRPASPRKAIILFLSAIMGMIFGSGMVLLKEYAQNTFRTPEDLEHLSGTTVMGQIPIIPARNRKKVLKYLTDKPTSAAAEAIRNLRTSILLSNVDKPPKIIMSTSSVPGEGKTTQSLALAQNLSGLGKKVLLVEGDIRRRTFAEYFEIKDKQGLLAVLSGEAKLEDVAIFNEDLKADILIGEKSAINAADVFSSDKFHKFLDDLREKYDYVIIDTPPVLAVPDARVIGQSVDAILYTVKWDSTTRRQVTEGLKSLRSVGAAVTGLVLAQINKRGMKRYGYGDSYGAYGDYYDN